jgi:hypothetical protein
MNFDPHQLQLCDRAIQLSTMCSRDVLWLSTTTVTGTSFSAEQSELKMRMIEFDMRTME